MRGEFNVLDMDRHVLEPMSIWAEYLPASMSDWVPRLQPWHPQTESLDERLARLGELALLPVPPVPTVRGKPIYRGMTELAYIELGAEALRRHEALAQSSSAAGQLESMDRSGVDVALLLPTYASYLVHDDEMPISVSRAYASAYNRWVSELHESSPERLKTAALVSCLDPERMPSDLEDALVHEPSAVMLRPNPIAGRTLADRSYDCFWQACQGNGLAVVLHEGTHARLATAGADRFQSRFGQHACSHPMEAMMAILSLIEGGVFERNPRLKVAVLEAGCGWLPYWLWRLDELEYANLPGEVFNHVRKAPSRYFRNQGWIALEPGEPMLEGVVQVVGADRLLFGTDFPHLDHSEDLVARLTSRFVDSPQVLRALLWNNAAELLGITNATTRSCSPDSTASAALEA